MKNTTISIPSALLTVSALLISCLIIIQMDGATERTAHAGGAIAGDEGYTLLTVSSGGGWTHGDKVFMGAKPAWGRSPHGG